MDTADDRPHAESATSTIPSEDWYIRRVRVLRAAMREWGSTGSGGGPSCDPFQGVVPASIATMMESRLAFTEESRALVSTTLIMFSAAGALIVLPFTQTGGNPLRDLVCHGLASLCLWMVYPVTGVMIRTAEAGYELYAANATYSAIVYRAAGIGDAPPAQSDAAELGKDFEDRMRKLTDLPHSWLEAVERSRHRAVHFTEWKQSLISSRIDWLRGWPPAIPLWRSNLAWPRNHRRSRGQNPRTAEDARELHQVWQTSGQSILHSLHQSMWFARVVASIGAMGLMYWAAEDITKAFDLCPDALRFVGAGLLALGLISIVGYLTWLFVSRVRSY